MDQKEETQLLFFLYLDINKSHCGFWILTYMSIVNTVFEMT